MTNGKSIKQIKVIESLSTTRRQNLNNLWSSIALKIKFLSSLKVKF